jgi:hypothetical protein
MLRRDGDRVWLDLDELYPPPHQHPNTVFKSMAIVFRAMGAKIDCVDVMGISAAAFRIQVGERLCPSSPHHHLGFACDDLVLEALGITFRAYEWDPRASGGLGLCGNAEEGLARQHCPVGTAGLHDPVPGQTLVE